MKEVVFRNEDLNYYITTNDKYSNYSYRVYKKKTTSYTVYYITTIRRFTNLNFNRYLAAAKSF